MYRVAQIVYQCIPNAGSDPGAGWHAVVSAARSGIEVHALTKESNRAAIEAHDDLENVTWHFIDVPEKLGPLATGSTVGDTLHLARWLRSAKEVCEDLVNTGRIDLTHFVTFSAFWMPVPFADIDAPHVFGPVGGGERVPQPLALTRQDRFAATLREIVQNTVMKAPSWRSLTSAPDTVVISASAATAKRLEAQGVNVIDTRAPACLTDELIDALDAIEPKQFDAPTLVMSGRQLRWKGHDIALRAMPLLLSHDPSICMEVLGSGPCHDDLKALVDELGVSESVHFRTSVDRLEERQIIAGADVFVLPSRRDAGSTLIPLVQILGVPLAALDTGAIRVASGGYAYLADPNSASPHKALAREILNALEASKDQDDAARKNAIEKYGELSAGEALNRWYEAAMSTRSSPCSVSGESS